ncbi:MAG TPA: GNAT family N-acetyltransferase [Candidatus Paceibacterota bacterium]|nr:GNAT family N-acetyltransferase [Candidatus Paceibacterota bacterium]
MIRISRFSTAQAADMKSANDLLRQLLHDPSEYKPISLKTLQAIVGERNTIAVVARDGKKMIGIGLLFVINKVRGKYGYLEDMIVDADHRGRGIGEKLTQKLLNVARSKKLKTIELSTRPSRIAANRLYQKFGFEHKETNVYRLKL